MVSFFTPLVGLTPLASAAVVSWDGDGADNNWSTAANWSSDTLPVDGDSLTFDLALASSVLESMNNDLTALNVSGITLTGAGSLNNSFLVTGNALTISGPITGTPESGYIVFDTDVALGANVTYDVDNSALQFGQFGSTNTFDLSTYDFTYSTPDTCLALSFNLGLAGSGNISSTSDSAGINIVSGAAGYSGDITTDGNGVAIYADAVYGFSTVTINGSGQLRLVGTDSRYHDINIVMNSSALPSIVTDQNGFGCSGAGASVGNETVTIEGNLTLNSDTVYHGIFNLDINGIYTSNGHTLSVKEGSTGDIITSEGTLQSPVTTTTIAAGDESLLDAIVVKNNTTTLNGKRGYAYVYNGGHQRYMFMLEVCLHQVKALAV